MIYQKMICHNNYDKNISYPHNISCFLDAFVSFFFLGILFRFQRSRDRANAFIIISIGFVFVFFYWLLFCLNSFLSFVIIKNRIA